MGGCQGKKRSSKKKSKAPKKRYCQGLNKVWLNCNVAVSIFG